MGDHLFQGVCEPNAKQKQKKLYICAFFWEEHATIYIKYSKSPRLKKKTSDLTVLSIHWQSK